MAAVACPAPLPDTEDNPRRASAELRLLEGVLRGDADAERAFVERFIPLIRSCVCRLARGRVSDPDLEDMIAEVWLCLFENDRHRLRRFDSSRDVRVSTWLAALARNRSIDYLRALQPVALEPGVDEELVDQAPTPSEALEQREHAELARRAMASLSDEERELLRALCVDEQETTAVARRLGIALPTVYSRRCKIAAKLARWIRSATRLGRPPAAGEVAA
jgi:RNA polymerase sigma-70 factor (ECF subfamily)